MEGPKFDFVSKKVFNLSRSNLLCQAKEQNYFTSIECKLNDLRLHLDV